MALRIQMANYVETRVIEILVAGFDSSLPFLLVRLRTKDACLYVVASRVTQLKAGKEWLKNTHSW